MTEKQLKEQSKKQSEKQSKNQLEKQPEKLTESFAKKLSNLQRKAFEKQFKCGIYKQLYEKKMLTENQLSRLLNQIELQQ